MFKFKTQVKDKKSKARAGVYETAHGKIETPCFVPVGTKATVKGLTPQDLKEIGVQILFANTYHLHLRPGEDLVQEFGGVAKFMGWEGLARRSSLIKNEGGPTMTDSGGFQVFSLGKHRTNPPASQDKLARSLRAGQNPTQNQTEESPSSLGNKQAPPQVKKKVLLEHDFQHNKEEVADLVKITNNGVKFRSHIDGSLHEFTPEVSIGIQKKLGADFILAFDECAPHPSTFEHTRQAMERTHEWALRSLQASKKSETQNPKSETISSKKNSNNQNVSNFDIRASNFDYYQWPQGIYGIIQGGVYEQLRKKSAEFINSQPFDAIAIGGVSVGESKKQMRNVVDWVYPYLPEDKTRHLLGIGEIDDIFDAVAAGMDTFDCVIPTRFGRYGIAFVGPASPRGGLGGPSEQEEKGKFRIDITKSKYANNKEPITNNCACYVCCDFTRAYIHHLFRSNELLAYRLLSYHNLWFVVNLVKDIRKAILEGKFSQMKKEWIG